MDRNGLEGFLKIGLKCQPHSFYNCNFNWFFDSLIKD